MASSSENVAISVDSDEEGEENGREEDVTSSAWHPVWKSFEKITQNTIRKTKCLVKNSNGKQCSTILSGWWPKNAMVHLKAKHRAEYEIRKQERTRIDKKSKVENKKLTDDRNQLRLPMSGLKYLPQHPKQRLVTKKLAKAFMANSLATRLIESDEFRDVINSLDEQYNVPSAYLLGQEEKLLFSSMKKNIHESLQSAAKIALTADLWTKRGGTESFIGITAHFFDKISHRRRTATLAIRELNGAHVAAKIYDAVMKILTEWDIPISKISKVVTDNGSNMIKAFQDSVQLAYLQETHIVEEPIIQENESAGLGNYNEENIMDTNWGLEQSFREDEDDDIAAEMANFDTEEAATKMAFFGLERLSCFAHSLQCSVRILDNSSFTTASRTKAFKLIESFAHSPKATQLLIEKTKKKLLTVCRTRWSYSCLALRRLLELRTAVDEITIMKEFPKFEELTNREWNHIERYVKFMQPFADATYVLEGDKYTTISEIIPQLLDLQFHLEEVSHSLRKF